MPVASETFPPAPAGMNVGVAQHELDDTEARYIQDALLDYPGRARQRGRVQVVPTIAQPTRPGTGLLIALNPQGKDRYAVLNGDATDGYVSVYADDLSALVDLAWPHPLPTDPEGSAATRYRIVDAKPSLTGGHAIGISSAYDSDSPNQGFAFWRGGNKANHVHGATLNVAKGSAALTGTGFTANVSPGMYLFAKTDEYTTTDVYIGVVLSVNSNTSITLGRVSGYALTNRAGTFQALRGLSPKVVKGRITCDVSAKDVNGGGTKFKDQGLATGSWDIYKQNDYTWVGKIDTVETNIHATLVANAAISLADEQYVALRADGDYSIITTANVNKVGFLSAVYAERQWYANLGAQFQKTTRVWFSDTNEPEGLDLAEDGDHFDIGSTVSTDEPIRMLMPAYNSLLVFKENETFAIYGQSPAQFSPKKLADDGTLSGGSVQPYGGGVIWAGREGIHYYDGIQVDNLIIKKFGDVWKNTIRSFDPTRYRMWSMIVRDHYILHIENLSPTIAVVKGNTSDAPTRWTLVINLVTRAPMLWTNVNLRGSAILPASTGRQAWYLVNTDTAARVCDAEDLFDADGVGADTVVSDGGIAGPDFFFESKKFDLGEPLLLKRWRRLLIHYLAGGGDLKVDLVLGLNNVGTTLTETLPGSVYTWDTLRQALTNWTAVKNQFATWSMVIGSVFLAKILRFPGQRSQHLSIRVYKESAATTRVQMGPFQIQSKPMRPGRV